MLINLIMLVAGIITFFVQRPFKQPYNNLEVRQVDKSVLGEYISKSVVGLLCTFFLMVSVSMFWNAFGEILYSLSKHKDFMDAIENVHIPTASLNGLAPLLLFMYIFIMFLGGWLVYLTIKNIVGVFKSIKRMNQQKHPSLENDLIKAISRNGLNDTASVYQQLLKERINMKLYLHQWEYVSKSLLFNEEYRKASDLLQYTESENSKRNTKNEPHYRTNKLIGLFENPLQKKKSRK
ncbi:hypothetical protein [Staphylococcus capitis]|uniref:hypothetical protein n=1 Tax=Staphylococcus capitis TaxID=29388 RepID=UPI00204192DB|nr:hypothetical protein [Staphylococcus capitis]